MNKDEKLINLLKHSNTVVGCRQVLRGLSEDTIRCVIVADDTEDRLKSVLHKAATEKNAEILRCKSMDWLGKQAGIEVKAAVVGIMKSED
ncbi:MAG: ribosomal L7Ae/L30e/S12e/Gadd45 family protein [Clostridia bacterium]|nr:ribosomal L7Ae/L30e/S12e/Gadd45 family protein [Clostridia bacterium]